MEITDFSGLANLVCEVEEVVLFVEVQSALFSLDCIHNQCMK